MSYLQFLENISVKGGDSRTDIKLPKPTIRKISRTGGKQEEEKKDNISIKYNNIKLIIEQYIHK